MTKQDEPMNRKAVTQAEMEKFYNDGPHIGARENDDGTWDMSAAARMANTRKSITLAKTEIVVQ